MVIQRWKLSGVRGKVQVFGREQMPWYLYQHVQTANSGLFMYVHICICPNILFSSDAFMPPKSQGNCEIILAKMELHNLPTAICMSSVDAAQL